MIDHQGLDAPAPPAAEHTRKSDGQDGPPVLQRPPVSQNVNTPGKLNSALKETPTEDEGYVANHPCAAHVRIVDRQHAIVAGVRKNIAICGFASSSRHAIPTDNPEWEIWGLNQFYRHTKRADRWADIHHNWDSENVPGTDHRGWIKDCGIPVYMLEAHADLPTSVRFPIERLIEKFGDYYTSTVALLLAVAIDEIDRRVEDQMQGGTYDLPADVVTAQRKYYDEFTIGIFGIDLVVGEEYFWQKACAEYFIGIAIGRGIRVMVPPNSALLRQQFRYGWHTEPDTVVKPREIEQHRKRLTAERDELLKRIYMMEGALQTLAALKTDEPKDAAVIMKERDETMKRALMLEGALEVDSFWGDLIDLRLRGADVRL